MREVGELPKLQASDFALVADEVPERVTRQLTPHSTEHSNLYTCRASRSTRARKVFRRCLIYQAVCCMFTRVVNSCQRPVLAR